ncbi:Heterokaryon incompatibility 6-like protein [Cladobotryum mycophilum]|uniref:Heterokaryon incompatibility 6-like protein n=1 Tax=Cladobotryum mycophilum TaxID=491253 RepID=A0ABR0S9R5_9HYPO
MVALHNSLNGQSYPGPSLPTPNHIRLVFLQPGRDDEITCELVTTELQSAPPYEAVSYTWGDPSDRRIIHIKTSESKELAEFSVTSNCFAALRRLRLDDRPRSLWIDALGIDQSDLAERNHQVTLMSQIYSQAAQVVIYLGEAGDNSNLAIDFMTERDNPSAGTTSLSFPKSTSLIQALEKFFRRPWFTRVWVIQEVILSSNGIAYCGDKKLSWSAVKNFNALNINDKWLPTLPFVASASKKSLTENDVEASMLKTLVQTRHCGATDPRDKVYGLLPLLHSFDKQLHLTPRYEDSVAEVYTACAIALISRCGFEILCSVQGGSSIDGLPSWVPDWSLPPKRKILGTFSRIGMSHIWPQKELDITIMPQVITRDTIGLGPKGTTPALRAAGYAIGKVLKIGTAYLAGQGPFPLGEWRRLSKEKIVAQANRDKGVPLHHDASEAIDYVFHTVIGAAGFAYSYAIKLFIGAENGSLKLDQSDDESRQDGESRKTWENTVCDMAMERGLDSMPYSDIPFHQAGKGQPPSYAAYTRFVLEHCHSRCFFITDTGYMGIAPAEIEVGDDIHVCVGAAIPFAFRQVQNTPLAGILKEFQLVGECYIETKLWEDIKETQDAPQYFDII